MAVMVLIVVVFSATWPCQEIDGMAHSAIIRTQDISITGSLPTGSIDDVVDSLRYAFIIKNISNWAA